MGKPLNENYSTNGKNLRRTNGIALQRTEKHIRTKTLVSHLGVSKYKQMQTGSKESLRLRDRKVPFSLKVKTVIFQ